MLTLSYSNYEPSIRLLLGYISHSNDITAVVCGECVEQGSKNQTADIIVIKHAMIDIIHHTGNQF